jgi:hypothetical protein
MHLGPGAGGGGSLVAALAAEGIADAVTRKGLVRAGQTRSFDDHIVVQ